jgi:hypothetical protein
VLRRPARVQRQQQRPHRRRGQREPPPARGALRRPAWIYEGALSLFCSCLLSLCMDFPHKRELKRANDRRPSSKPAAAARTTRPPRAAMPPAPARRRPRRPRRHHQPADEGVPLVRDIPNPSKRHPASQQETSRIPHPTIILKKCRAGATSLCRHAAMIQEAP